MDAAALAPLLTPEGRALLESLPRYDPANAMALANRLRAQGHEPATVSAVLTQARLRDAARGKFGDLAGRMLFTPEGLEQATRREIAALHAERFAAAGVGRVADLGCGIGGDAMALAGRGLQVLAVERDDVTAGVATVNLRPWPHAVVRTGDVARADLTGVDAAFVDPSRRTPSGRRVLDPRLGSPPLSFVTDLAERLPAVGCKTAPGIAHVLIPDAAQAQWVSVAGDVVEAALWFGSLARDGVRRSALVLPGAGGQEAVELTDVGLPDAQAGPLGPVLYEPDGALIRAGLVAHVASAVAGRLLDPSIAYVSADRLIRTPLARAYAVQDCFGFQLKTLRAWLRTRGIGKLTIKKRGTAVEPEQLRRRLRLSGDGEATVVLTRVAGRQSVIVVRPVSR